MLSRDSSIPRFRSCGDRYWPRGVAFELSGRPFRPRDGPFRLRVVPFECVRRTLDELLAAVDVESRAGQRQQRPFPKPANECGHDRAVDCLDFGLEAASHMPTRAITPP